MSLIVSLRIPDGLVIAGDSLATMQTQLQIAGQLDAECPECHKGFKITDVKAPPIPIASSTRSYAQKVFPLQGKFGIGTTGLGALNNKTIYYHVKTLSSKAQFSNVTAVAQYLEAYFHSELKKQISDLEQQEDNYFPLGLQVVGYDGEEGKTIKVDVGKQTKITPYGHMGCTISGETQLVTQIWQLGKNDNRQAVSYQNFSLQDAIDYATFLINTTAAYQRFSNRIPSVGGEVDIGLITPYNDFTWIRCKPLTKVLEGKHLDGSLMGSGTDTENG